MLVDSLLFPIFRLCYLILCGTSASTTKATLILKRLRSWSSQAQRPVEALRGLLGKVAPFDMDFLTER